MFFPFQFREQRKPAMRSLRKAWCRMMKTQHTHGSLWETMRQPPHTKAQLNLQRGTPLQAGSDEQTAARSLTSDYPNQARQGQDDHMRHQPNRSLEEGLRCR